MEKSVEVRFPEDFCWGAATASYQIEGATTEGGRGPSIWDTFVAQAGTVLNGDTGDTAADHYHRFREDVRILQQLGIGNYRFSIAWPRIQPTGTGAANAQGLDFYEQLVDTLLAAGIQPWPTLYHWDLPQELEDAGGWPERDTAYRFADYTELVAERLGDRVSHWWTVNEPWVVANLGYATGEHAPGRRDHAAAAAAIHHLLLGHGLATQRLRSVVAEPSCAVGIALNPQPIRARTSSVADLDAARRIDGTRNRIFLDPLYYGRYPSDVCADLADVTDFSFVRDGDLATIASRLDFLGVNYYNSALVEAAPAGQDPDNAVPLGHTGVRDVPRPVPRTDQDWEVDASGLTELLTRITVDYPETALYVTENGASYRDEPTANGEVHDPQRLAFLDSHIRATHAALEAGAPVRGYFVWSLLDNFEWAFGYRERFGIVYVDYSTQQRIVKDSGHWYSGITRTGRLPAGSDTPDPANSSGTAGA
ncbi:GH1 family beta-glucosidase [Lipingzhangella sp. LS1_29]|uniref:Beta-glucosidase n=1 Tax=Lipingzhangella rawalii TaxID=2055835 RepID=A0ABU2HB67_9ACTN|nr:GH1 family beta-glucosidase [Lipingzhangella rawalii]MDS1272508.1 GH1 family beta-glucosidase [Lipingzhangella rawalii]